MKIESCRPDCPERNAFCHSTCEKYKKERSKKDAENDNRWQIIEREMLYADYMIEQKEKCARRRRRKG